jgi:hypothetical protein
MTGNTFRPDAVEHAKALIRSGIRLPSVRLRIFHEFPSLTGFGISRVLDIAREEIAEHRITSARRGKHDHRTGGPARRP